MSKKNGQATIEFVLVFGVLFLLLIGLVRVMGWFNRDLVQRQRAYFDSRVDAGINDRARAGAPLDYDTEELSVF